MIGTPGPFWERPLRWIADRLGSLLEALEDDGADSEDEHYPHGWYL